jgi:hypothetical protein
MGDYYGDQWKTWHEGPPRRDRRWLLILGIGLAALLLLAVCGAGYWFVLRPLLAEPTPAAEQPAPTLPGGGGTQAALVTPLSTPQVSITDAPATPAAGTPVAPSTDALPATASATPPAATGADFTVSRLAQPPVLDGSLTEWPEALTVSSAFQVYARAGWDGSADLEATWRLGWDPNSLYLAVTVVDDLHVQTQTGNQMFRGDSVEIQIDTNRAANATLVNPGTFQLLLSPGNFADLAPSAFRFQGTGEGRILDAPGHRIQVNAARTGEGYVLEAAIPWSDLNFVPDEADVLGIALNANDNDQADEAVQEVMMSSSPRRTLTDPQSWGTMVLE